MSKAVRAAGFMFATVFAFALAGCTGSEPAADVSAREGILHFGNEAEPQSLDPHIVTGLLEQRVLVALLEGLVGVDHDGNVVPGIAESWEVSGDKLTYTFKIRKNARWSNGDPVTAKDFTFSYQRILMPEFGAPYAYMLYCMKNAEAFHNGEIDDPKLLGAKAIDDRTLEIALENPTPYFLTMQIHFTWLPVHRKSIEAVGPAFNRTTPWTTPETFVCNGPFKLAAWRPKEILIVEKNPEYWDAENVKLNGIHFYPIDNRQTEERMFRVGDLHITSNVPPTKLDTYRRENPDALRIAPTYGTYFYRFNVTASPLENKNVRRALAMSIDRQMICETLLRAGQEPATAFTPPDPNSYVPRASIPYDPEAAKALLKEAGYESGADVPPVEILYNTDDVHREIAEAVQAMWKQNLGIDARILNQDWKTYLESMNLLDYSVCRSSWWGDVLDPINFLECFESDGGNNRTGWKNEEFDALIERARAEPDADARFDLLQQAEEILMDEAPIAPIYTYVTTQLVSPQVRGFKQNMLSHYQWKAISLAPDAR